MGQLEKPKKYEDERQTAKQLSNVEVRKVKDSTENLRNQKEELEKKLKKQVDKLSKQELIEIANDDKAPLLLRVFALESPKFPKRKFSDALNNLLKTVNKKTPLLRYSESYLSKFLYKTIENSSIKLGFEIERKLIDLGFSFALLDRESLHRDTWMFLAEKYIDVKYMADRNYDNELFLKRFFKHKQFPEDAFKMIDKAMDTDSFFERAESISSFGEWYYLSFSEYHPNFNKE
jgi:hypothetical protein